MAEPKPLASLSAGLLARKGAARPAMRRQAQSLGLGTFGNQEDLGWNDMGYDVDPHDGGFDQARSVDHGLSPMASTLGAAPHIGSDRGADRLPDALDALGQAVDRAIGQPAPIVSSTVQPLDSRSDVPAEAEPPAVHEQQQRLERALAPSEVPLSGPVEPATEAQPVSVEPESEEPVPTGALDAIRSAMTATPVATPVAIPARAPSSVAVQQAAAQQKVPAQGSPLPRSRAGSRGNFAFTLRLDPHRHLRLRLASATSNRSAQQIIIQLIDDYLADLPEIDAFAAQVPASKSDR